MTHIYLHIIFLCQALDQSLAIYYPSAKSARFFLQWLGRYFVCAIIVRTKTIYNKSKKEHIGDKYVNRSKWKFTIKAGYWSEVWGRIFSMWEFNLGYITSVYLDFDVYSEEEIDSLYKKQNSFWKRLFQVNVEIRSSCSSAPRCHYIGRTSVLESEGTKPISFMEKYTRILTDLSFFIHVLTWCTYEKHEWPFWNNIYGDSQIMWAFGGDLTN